MSQTPEEKAVATAREAQELIKQVKRRLQDGDDELRDLGLDPDKVREFSARGLDEDGKREVAELLRRDLQEVDDEVNRSRVQRDAPTKSRRPRNMI